MEGAKVPQDMGTNGLRDSPQMEEGTDGQMDDRHTAYAESRVCRTTRSKLVPTLKHTQQPAALNAVLQGWKTTRAHTLMSEPASWEGSSEVTEELESTEINYFHLETNQVQVLQSNKIKTSGFIREK